MRIAVITQWYPPENVWVPKSVVNALRDGGHNVTVITGVPYYPSGDVATGYSAVSPRDEIIDGIKVLRVPEYPYRGKHVLGRLVGYASFAATCTIRALLIANRIDAVFVYASPATSALPAMTLRAVAQVPFILQIQDVWPDSVVDSGFVRNSKALGAISAVLGGLVSLSYKLSAKVIVISPSAKRLLETRGVPSKKIEVLFNWVDDPRVPEISGPGNFGSLRDLLGLDSKTRVFIYAGSMGPAQDLSSVIAAFSAAQLAERATLVLVGSGVAFNELQELSKQVDGVHVHGPVPLATARRWTAESDVGIVSLADTQLHRSTFPSKIQLLTGIGLPLLVRAPGDTSALAVQTGSGVGVSSFDVDSLASAFRKMTAMHQDELDRMGMSARRWYEQSFSPGPATSRLNSFISELSQPPPRGRSAP